MYYTSRCAKHSHMYIYIYICIHGPGSRVCGSLPPHRYTPSHHTLPSPPQVYPRPTLPGSPKQKVLNMIRPQLKPETQKTYFYDLF